MEVNKISVQPNFKSKFAKNLTTYKCLTSAENLENVYALGKVLESIGKKDVFVINAFPSRFGQVFEMRNETTKKGIKSRVANGVDSLVKMVLNLAKTPDSEGFFLGNDKDMTPIIDKAKAEFSENFGDNEIAKLDFLHNYLKNS